VKKEKESVKEESRWLYLNEKAKIYRKEIGPMY